MNTPCRLLASLTPTITATVAAVVAFFALAVAATPPLGAAPGWIHDGSGAPPRLSVEQAIWAMGKLPRGGTEWTPSEQAAQIAAAGFDSVMIFQPATEAEQDRWRDLAAAHGLALTLQCAPADVAELERALAAVRRMKARGLVAMVRPTFVSYEEGEAKIRAMMAASAAAGVPFYLETHRGTITQDILLTRRWAESIPGLQIHADLSHFVISYEIGGPPAGPIAAAFDAILARTGMIDGRIGNGEQVQIDVGPAGDSPHAKLFASWWKKAMVAWLAQAGPGDVFVFKPELGPPAYSIVDAEGRELSDRWAQALVVRDLGIRTWNEAVAEAGRGQRYAPRAAAAAAAPAGPPKSDGIVLEIFALRGDCVKLGDYYLGGQPVQPAYQSARELGIRSVINVRMPVELGGLGFDVEDTAKAAGLEYHHVPVSPETLDDALAERFIDAVRKSAKPVLIHGSNGNRVWGLWSLYAGVEWGVAVDDTAKLAAEHGIERLVVDRFARDYLKRKGKSKSK